MIVYLCGPILGCSDEECKDWREAAKKVLSHTLDPMRRDYRGREQESYKEIVEQDKADIDQADALLVNYDRPSVGTSMEILYAWQQGKPVYVVTKPETVISPWLRYHAEILYSFASAFERLSS